MYPKLVVDMGKIAANVRAVVGLCAGHGVEVCGVTKGVCGEPRLARAFADNGVSAIGDSRLADLERLQGVEGLEVPKLLLRTPSPEEADDVVRLADASVETELATLQALDGACERAGGKRHGVLLMCDLGDLREGFLGRDSLLEAARFVARSRHLDAIGVGANLNCLSFILPDTCKMEELVSLARAVEDATGSQGLVVSGGNSSTLKLLMSGGLPEGVNQLRLGESLLLGRERAGYSYLPGTRNDAFVFQARVVEVKDKPSKPWGTSGVDSYGRAHKFEDRGMRRHAIVAFGHQDTEAEVMWPLDSGVEIVDSSSDHTVLDVSDASRRYAVGDVVEFRCGYHAVARAFASPYVQKEFVD